jgi:hypothetical protein
VFSEPVDKRTFETMGSIIKAAILAVQYEVTMALLKLLRAAGLNGQLKGSFIVLAFDGAWNIPRNAPHHCQVIMWGRIPVLVLTMSKCAVGRPRVLPFYSRVWTPPPGYLRD